MEKLDARSEDLTFDIQHVNLFSRESFLWKESSFEGYFHAGPQK